MIDVLPSPDLFTPAALRPVADPAAPREATERSPDRLVADLRRGDAGAFEALYRQLVAWVFGLAVRLAHDRNEAEELTQEVFVRVWEARSRFDSALHLRNWLRRVTVNHWIDRARRNRNVSLDDEGPGAAAATGALAVPAATPGARLDLERALGLLSPRLRAVLVLFDIYGLDHAEIGATLGMTAGASKVQLHRARRRLRELLP
jgi:RNA polymerase sigma-70 factor (ECF subfamily)